MSFLSRVFKESVSVHRNLGRVGVNLLQGDLSGAAAAQREANRTVVHGLKRDLLGDKGDSNATRTNSTDVMPYRQTSAWQSHSQQMLHACRQIGNQWDGIVGQVPPWKRGGDFFSERYPREFTLLPVRGEVDPRQFILPAGRVNG